MTGESGDRSDQLDEHAERPEQGKSERPLRWGDGDRDVWGLLPEDHPTRRAIQEYGDAKAARYRATKKPDAPAPAPFIADDAEKLWPPNRDGDGGSTCEGVAVGEGWRADFVQNGVHGRRLWQQLIERGEDYGLPRMGSERHVEGIVAAEMRLRGIDQVTLYVNRTVCATCRASLERMLLPGMKMTVYGPTECVVFEGKRAKEHEE
ncbi:MAG TPA: DddA-like double-stranded DNA deaminase toxin [Chloroflexota bacterium]